MTRAMPVRLLLAAVLLATAAPTADAQWWPFRRRREPAPPVQPTVPVAPPEAAPPLPAPEAAAAAAQAADRQRYFNEARALEMSRDSTAQNAQERLNAWSLVRAIAPGDPDALQGHRRAQRDLELAQRREQSARVQAVDSAARAQVRVRLHTAQASMERGDFRSAEATVGEVLATYPDDPQARSVQASIAEARRNHELRRLYLLLGGGMLLGGGGVGYFAWRELKAARQRAAERAAARQAYLQVIDGVGQGKMVPVTEAVFRIGAVGAETPEERNDLVLSDAERAISRHHCTIVRRGGDYYLIDASRNGTWLNGEALTRGEQRRLEDEDEVVMADAVRLKFLVT